jgi:hypothetical protein
MTDRYQRWQRLTSPSYTHTSPPPRSRDRGQRLLSAIFHATAYRTMERLAQTTNDIPSATMSERITAGIASALTAHGGATAGRASPRVAPASVLSASSERCSALHGAYGSRRSGWHAAPRLPSLRVTGAASARALDVRARSDSRKERAHPHALDVRQREWATAFDELEAGSVVAHSDVCLMLRPMVRASQF